MLVILHGWGQNKKIWTEFIDKCGTDNVVAIDLPGFGDEPLISKEWGIPEYAEWVIAKLDAYPGKSITLLGHSFGGRIASLIASQRPAWLKSLILYASPSLYRPSRAVKNKIQLRKLLRKVHLHSFLPKNQELLDADKSGLGRIFRNAVNFDQTEQVKKITVPTLLLWGSQDLEAPVSIAYELDKLISDTELIILDDLGHNIHLDNPNLFYGKVQNFIQGN